MRFVFALLLVFVLQAQAAVYYVDFVGGLDGNPGTIGSPKKTIPATLASGDTVYLKRGITYGASYTFANSGTVLVYGSNGAVDATGLVFTSAGATFVSSGVTTAHTLYIAGEGLFTIASVDSEIQLTLGSATQHRNISNEGYAIANPIKITIDPAWGTGSALVTGYFGIQNKSAVWIDGSVTNGIEIIPGAARGVYGTAGSVTRCRWIRNLNIHGTTGDNAAIHLQYADYALVQGCYLHDIGDHGATSGDDGITVVTSGTYTTLDNNEIYEIGDDGIHVAPMHKGYIQRNVIHRCWSNGAHSDGLAFNAASSFDCTIRYNTLYDNASPSDVEAVQFNLYYNVFYDTSTTDGLGNVGWRYKLGAGGTIRNNVFANNAYWAINSGTGSGAVTVENNIFWENNYLQPTSKEHYLPAGSTLRNNIYRRTNRPVTGDIIFSVNGVDYTLATAQAAGYESGGLYYEDATLFFLDETQAAFNPRPLNGSRPQVFTGRDVSLPFDRDWTAVPAAPCIGAFEFTPPAGSYPGTIALAAATQNVNEGDGTVTITATRTGGSDGEVTIGYTTANGTALAGSDYTATSGTLTWTAADTANKTFAVTITDDPDDDESETFTAVLSNPTGGATLGAPGTNTVTIIDNDPTQTQMLSIAPASTNKYENAGSVNITVLRTGTPTGSVSVDYTTANGTALVGTDYTAAAATLTLGNGVTSGTIPVTIIDDAVFRGSRSFYLQLYNPTGATLVETNSTITILDNEAGTRSRWINLRIK